MEPKLALVVDDDDANREVICQVIELLVGAETVTAADGEEALSRLRERRPDIVVLDLLLPRLGGEEVIRRLKADPRTRSIPIVAVTAHPGAVAGATPAADADACLGKPFDPDRLAATVRGLLGRSPSIDFLDQSYPPFSAK